MKKENLFKEQLKHKSLFRKDITFIKICMMLIAFASVLALAPLNAKAAIKVPLDTSIEPNRDAGRELYDTKCYYHNALPLDISISNGYDASKLHDERYSTTLALPEGTEINVNSSVTMKGLYVIWDGIVPEWTLKIGDESYTYGTNGFLHEYIELPKEATSVTIVMPSGANSVERGSKDMRIADIIAFDQTDDLPAWVQVWEPVCEQADILVLATHADDEIIFLGSVAPIYQVERNMRVQYAYFTTYWNIPDQHIREHEKLNGLWLAGCKYYPIMSAFDDNYAKTYEGAAQYINEEDARTYLTRCIRLSHPKVVVTQDLNGEYGHGQHMFLANNVVNAVDLAADATYDAESLEKYGAWEVDKFYIHIYPENQINLDMRTPLDSFDGKRAIDVARQAYLCHQSQQWCDFTVDDYGPYSAGCFGLYKTRVGEDVAKNDLMENVVSYEEEEELARIEKERLEEEARIAEEERLAKEEADRKAALEVAQDEDDKKPEKKEKNLSEEETIIIVAIVVLVVITIGAGAGFVVYNNNQKKKRRRRRRRR